MWSDNSPTREVVNEVILILVADFDGEHFPVEEDRRLHECADQKRPLRAGWRQDQRQIPYGAGADRRIGFGRATAVVIAVR